MGSLFIYIVYYAYIPALVIDCRFSNRDVSVIYLRSPVVGTFICFFRNIMINFNHELNIMFLNWWILYFLHQGILLILMFVL